MRVTNLRVDGVRNLTAVDLRPAPGLNLLLGRNGAGKTSVIEALHVLAHGRSFRTGQIDTLVKHGTEGFTTFVQCRNIRGREQTLGMSRHSRGWMLKLDHAPVSTLVDFVRNCAVVTIEPESHLLMTGGAEGRRRYLDWLLFHVEPDFLAYWRRYLRALRQRNAALKVSVADESLVHVWEAELAVSGERIDLFRRQLLDDIHVTLKPLMQQLLNGCTLTGVHYRQGWPVGSRLADALADGRKSDRERGFTQRGPHRSDLRLEFAGDLNQAQLSRGQAKLAAVTCLLAQAVHYHQRSGDWPIFACDDLASELDAEHQSVLLEWLVGTGGQVFISGTEQPALWAKHVTGQTARFHVEQGYVTPC